MIRVSSLMFVVLAFVAQVAPVESNKSGDILVRKRREWIIPPTPLKENVDYTHKQSIARIRSDFENATNIVYSLEGSGANQYPFNMFVIDPKTGYIRVTKVLDREDIDTYTLRGVATYSDGSHAEKKLDIRIKVEDENDNAPVFGVIESGKVDELSPVGTSVMKITATDADEPLHENSQIAYSIIDQKPPDDMFFIASDGTVYINKPFLDREKADRYTLTVKGQDLNGKPGGNSAITTVNIMVNDVNDNLPTLDKEQYVGSIEENTENVEIMRIKANDVDLESTDNWKAVYAIVKGNEAGYFSIRTDPNTNEGILMLDKAVNYEDVKNLELGLVVRNKAPLVGDSGGNAGAGINLSGGGGGGGGAGAGGGGAGGGGGGAGGGGGGAGGGGGGAGGVGGGFGGSGTSAGVVSGGSSWWSSSGTIFKTYPIKINVKNVPEGPHFDPKVKAIPISEGGHSFNIQDIIAQYTAIDEDTGKPAEKVRYAKGSDPDNWLTIDPKTAGIKLNKMPDRESPFLVNGTYIAQILCITEDMPSKTATGTVAIQVEDFNDHCPTLTSDTQTMCTTDNAVIVTAKDEDAYPNGSPFDFNIVPEGTKGKWHVEHLNDTTAILRVQESLWPGFYEVEFVVRDQQGEACPEPQKVNVLVCTCEDGAVCGKGDGTGEPTKGAELGPAGIGLLFLGLLLLALIPLLLLFCQCGDPAAGLSGGFTEMPFDTKSHLINYRTEGQGENTDVPLLNFPTQIDGDMDNTGLGIMSKAAAAPIASMDFQKSVTSMDGINGALYQGSEHRDETWGMMNHKGGSGPYSVFESKKSSGGGGLYDGMALPDHFLKRYYIQKVTNGNNNHGVKDSQLIYDYEGQGSSAGSVGCCSILEAEDDLQFLEDLGPKFKTLAEVCKGKTLSVEVTPLPSVSARSQTSLSSLMTPPQLPPLTQLQATVIKTDQSVIKGTSEYSQVVKESIATKRGEMENQGQMLLLQNHQPVYYTTTPVLQQPMHYIVQPQVQNTVLLAEASASNLQNVILVNGAQTGPAQGMVIQGQTVVSNGQYQPPSMMLVQSSGAQGGGTNMSHTGKLSGSQTMMVVGDKVPAGSMQVLKGGQTCLVQGDSLQSKEPVGSQRMIIVGGPISSDMQLVQKSGLKSKNTGSQKVLYSKETREKISKL